MSKLIICAQTGTILHAEHCYVVEDGMTSPEAMELGIAMMEGDDSAIGNIAKTIGISVVKMGEGTGWGDNQYRWTVSYSPRSLRDEAYAYLEGGVYEESDPEYAALVWVAEQATQEELESLSDDIMSHDSVWDGFRSALVEQVRESYANRL